MPAPSGSTKSLKRLRRHNGDFRARAMTRPHPAPSPLKFHGHDHGEHPHVASDAAGGPDVLAALLLALLLTAGFAVQAIGGFPSRFTGAALRLRTHVTSRGPVRTFPRDAAAAALATRVVVYGVAEVLAASSTRSYACGRAAIVIEAVRRCSIQRRSRARCAGNRNRRMTSTLVCACCCRALRGNTARPRFTCWATAGSLARHQGGSTSWRRGDRSTPPSIAVSG